MQTLKILHSFKLFNSTLRVTNNSLKYIPTPPLLLLLGLSAVASLYPSRCSFHHHVEWSNLDMSQEDNFETVFHVANFQKSQF